MSGAFANLQWLWSQVATGIESNMIDTLFSSHWGIFSVSFTSDVLIYVIFIAFIFVLWRFIFQIR